MMYSSHGSSSSVEYNDSDDEDDDGFNSEDLIRPVLTFHKGGYNNDIEDALGRW